jgi:Fusaric acid resistance protein-like
MFKQIIEFKETNRPWHLPVLAGLCIGIPILGGYYFGLPQEGKLASLAALVILYIQSFNIVNRMITLMTCSFCILFSFTVGILFSFNPYLAPIVLGGYTFLVHLGLYHLRLTRPPGNFFFIMIASIAICTPFDAAAIPAKIGYVAIGTMISCSLGLFYSIITLRNATDNNEVVISSKNKYENFTESIIYGCFIGFSLLIANLLKLNNPYWVPTSCIAVMQGVNTQHIWARSAQRILGTLLGLAATWAILLLHPSVFIISISIIILQVIVEFFVVRNYAVAAIFITILTIFLAESNNVLTEDHQVIFGARFLDILIGSVIGAIGGWVLHNREIHSVTKKQIRKTKVMLKKRNF